ncbi:dihydrodipicolinate synthase family protein [Paenibacillus ginsengarvi]|uniref:Dihydrodipicolinate synthase family protein n=1 Tax=Paenibacillus ginsengarvi TaxID=400777 RepID=A0A3B0CES8_9BACL|nr:dihydrodipicolinate synthase family protein [Paenibacillus ginsengarvi]RKN84515.1 dihydrodipicolinate synthase family protein [Paenibacillus ginsengarvi]
MRKQGFYPALGTPLDDSGYVIAESLQRHAEDQLKAGAAGLLVMGSMGQQPYIRGSETGKIAKVVVEAVSGACPVFVGVMDNSIERVKERIALLGGIAIDGIVATTPFYYAVSQPDIYHFFASLAKASPYPVYLYDLTVVTQSKITVETAARLMTVPNIAGIKTGDLTTARVLSRMKSSVNPEFKVLYSGLDTFDAAYGYGIAEQLDGMFSCTAAITSRLYKELAAGDSVAAAKSLDDILLLRDTFVEVGVFPGFTHAMNLLGFAGTFHPDYMRPIGPESQVKVKACMTHLGLL